jgi:membrane-associated phospholipid phosphatase
VHHAQDVLAGLAIGVAAGALAVWVVHLLMNALQSRGLTIGSRARTTADRSSRRHA